MGFEIILSKVSNLKRNLPIMESLAHDSAKKHKKLTYHRFHLLIGRSNIVNLWSGINFILCGFYLPCVN